MATPRLPNPLNPLGLSPESELVYEALLDIPSASAVELAELTGDDVAQVTTHLDLLERRGLLTRAPQVPPRFSARPPEIALEAEIVHRMRSLRALHGEIRGYADRFRVAQGRGQPPQLIEIVTGREALATTFNQVVVGATTTLDFMSRPPLVSPGGEPTDGTPSYEPMGGVVIRSVYSTDLLVPPTLEIVLDMVASGRQVRAATDVPVKLVIADDEIALLGVYAEDRFLDQGLLVRGAGLLDALNALFESCWESAAPVTVTGNLEPSTGPAQPSDGDLLLISLVLTGLPDSAVAYHLGISVRTLFRRLRDLMALARVDSRAPLMFEAGRRGWLDAADIRAARSSARSRAAD